MSEMHNVEWIDREREPQCAPDPDYPDGKDIPPLGDGPNCLVELPYPAKRCGVYVITCSRCGRRVGVTTAGRPDDPRSVRIDCGETLQ